MGIGRLVASVLLSFSGRIKEFTTRKTFYLFEIVYFSFLVICLGFVKNPWVIASLFIVINAFKFGLSHVSNSYLIDIIHGSRFKATLLSVTAQMDSLVAGAAGFLFGVGVTYFSYTTSFMLTGLSMLLSLSLLYFYMRNSKTVAW